jgi:hypothetical protein
MRRLVVAGTIVAALLGAPPAAAQDGFERCATPRDFTTGPFFADQVKARVVSCRAARRFVKRWGRTRDCVMPRGGPSDKVCFVRGYRCVTRQVGYETLRAGCKRRGTRRAVKFRFGS